MDDIADHGVGPMMNPPHLGELIRKSMEADGQNVKERKRGSAASA